ncbi:MAG: ATP-binding protein [Lachnospiraceae bacterium]|nr:ATP-binding protein [Lachnospiraceae bacterium]
MSELQVEADVKELDKVQDFIREELEKYDVSMKAMYQIELAVEEIYTNISSYAYNPEVGKATINCSVAKDPLQVVIQFLDSGKPFDPLSRDEADTSSKALLERTGGLGIFLVKKNMDDVEYSYEDGKNVLTISKTLEE